MNWSRIWLLAVLGCGSSAFGQEISSSVYELRFRLNEIDAATGPASRLYSMVVESGSAGKINAGRRVPFYSASQGGANEQHTAALGNIFECEVAETDWGVRLDCAFESSYVEPGQSEEPQPVGMLPLTHSRQVHTTAVVPLGREIRLAMLDDPASGNRLEIFIELELLSPRDPGWP